MPPDTTRPYTVPGHRLKIGRKIGQLLDLVERHDVFRRRPNCLSERECGTRVVEDVWNTRSGYFVPIISDGVSGEDS